MNVLRSLGVFTFIVALVGIVTALRLPLTEEFSIGPGMMPLIYASGLLVVSGLAAFRPGEGSAFDLSALSLPQTRNGILLLVLLVALAVMAYFFGFVVAIFVFTCSVLTVIVKMSPVKALLFSVVWTAVLYFVFAQLLSVRLPVGIIFNI